MVIYGDLDRTHKGSLGIINNKIQQYLFKLLLVVNQLPRLKQLEIHHLLSLNLVSFSHGP
jgi:hypothetical protein